MRFLACLLGFVGLLAIGHTHPADVPSALAKVQVGGAVELRVRFDVLSFVLDGQPREIADSAKLALVNAPVAELQSRLDEAKATFLQGLQGIDSPSVVFPRAAEVVAGAQANGMRFPVMLTAVVSGQVPAGSLSLRFPDVLGTVILTVEMPYQEPYSEPVDPGSFSTSLPVPTKVEVDKAAMAMQPAPAPPPVPAKAAPKRAETKPVPLLNPDDLRLTTYDFQPTSKAETALRPTTEAVVPGVGPVRPSPPTTEPPTQPRPPWYALMGRYVEMGFRHIVPQGLDHILFVLGLFLLSRKTKDLLTQISCFTLAHSLTLGLALYGVVRLPASIVEPLIALSIVFVAVENLFTTEMKAWRPFVVFGFGLVHGLGFAGALQDAGLAKANFLTALIGFNGGVELGQLSVVATAFLLIGWLRPNPHYRQAIVIPASLATATIALIWTVQRVV